MMPTRARSERQYRRRQPEDHYNLHRGHHGLHPSAEVNREAIEHGEKDDNRNRPLDPVIRHLQKTFKNTPVRTMDPTASAKASLNPSRRCKWTFVISSSSFNRSKTQP